jgi:glycosyltransferase involved in cell wall biosynthesis
MARLADLAAPSRARPAGTRVMLDLRPLQEPARAPITAAYLRSLLRALEADPLPGEEIVEVLRVGRSDPVGEEERERLAVAAKRWLPPPSRGLRSFLGVPVDAVLLRAAQVRTGTGAGAGTVFHTAGGATPLRSSMPVVSTLLDLAPWELPDRYAASRVARLARRARESALRRASVVLVGSRATAEAAAALVGIDPDRIRVVPLAADEVFRPDAIDPERLGRLLEAHRLPPRYLLVGGRYDARSDLSTLFAALRSLRDGGTPPDALPHVVLTGVAPADEARDRIAALVRHHRVEDLVHATPALPVAERAALEAGAVGHVQAALSDATGMAALEALAAGVPVIASRAGALPEIVGPAGIIVEPREPARLAAALVALWSGGRVAGQVSRAARTRAVKSRRTWSDVCRDTREAWAAAVGVAAHPDATGHATR